MALVQGTAGVGKTRTVLSAIPNAMPINNRMTLAEFYNVILANPDATLVLDDLNWKDLTSMIMSATNTSPRRFVHYHTATMKVPKSTEFKGKIIIVTNSTKDKIPEPLLSRAYCVEVKFTYDEILHLISEVCKTDGIPLEVARFIEVNSSPATENLDLRTLHKINGLRQSFPAKWRKLALHELQRNPKLQVILELQTTNLNVEEQAEKFCEQFGTSRATYYNWKRKL